MRQDEIIMRGGGKPMDTAFTTQFEKRSFVPESAELKAHEKRAIVSHFLHNDQVFVHLCEYLF